MGVVSCCSRSTTWFQTSLCASLQSLFTRADIRIEGIWGCNVDSKFVAPNCGSKLCGGGGLPKNGGVLNACMFPNVASSPDPTSFHLQQNKYRKDNHSTWLKTMWSSKLLCRAWLSPSTDLFAIGQRTRALCAVRRYSSSASIDDVTEDDRRRIYIQGAGNKGCFIAFWWVYSILNYWALLRGNQAWDILRQLEEMFICHVARLFPICRSHSQISSSILNI